MKFKEIFERMQAGQMNREDAERVPGVPARIFRSREGRLGAESSDGLLDRRLHRISCNRILADIAAEEPELYDTTNRRLRLADAPVPGGEEEGLARPDR